MSGVLNAAADLTTISLDELIQRGSLQTRIDRKYALTRADAEMVLALMDRDSTLVLEIDGERSLGYSSAYLDSPELSTFQLAARRRRQRFKVRTRRYDSNGAQFLEVKTRFRAQTVKHRLPGEHLADGVLTQRGLGFVADVLGDAGVGLVDLPRFATTLQIDYRRINLFLVGSGTRVTIDTDLAWHDLVTGERLVVPDLAIIETKSSNRPSEVDRLLWSCALRPDRISKYSTGLAALRPELPSNRWHRVLHEHFSDATLPVRQVA
ncbi:MAG: polyphosphate polymerase domain-containing protein [Micropruina sp.]|nr:polyphosphate polymerase domain-containing protein [Micropruina sp.]